MKNILKIILPLFILTSITCSILLLPTKTLADAKSDAIAAAAQADTDKAMAAYKINNQDPAFRKQVYDLYLGVESWRSDLVTRPDLTPEQIKQMESYINDGLARVKDKLGTEAHKEGVLTPTEEAQAQKDLGLTGTQTLPPKAAAATKPTDTDGPTINCGWNPFSKECLLSVTGWIMWALGWLFSWILTAANNILGLSINYSVVNFKSIAGTTQVADAWKKVRDVTNIIFIFMLLYIAIGTMFQTVSAKQTLPKVIILALLVNFSFFFASIPIDASNVVANGLLQSISNQKNTSGIPDISTEVIQHMGVTQAFLSQINIDMKQGGGAWSTGLLASLGKTILQGVLTILMTLLTTFVVLVAALLLLIRAVTLLFILVLSPFGLAAFAVPYTEKYGKQWRDELLSQAFYAPAFFLVFSLPIAVAKISNPPSDLAGILVNFIVLGGLMMGSVIVAKSLGAKGVGMATAVSGGVTGYAAYRMTNAAKGLAGGTARAIYNPVAGGVTWASRKTGVTGTLKNIKTNVGEVFGGSGKAIKNSGPGKFISNTYGKSFSALGKDLKADFKDLKNFATKPKDPLQTINKAFKDTTGFAPLGKTRDERRESEKKAKEESDRTKKEDDENVLKGGNKTEIKKVIVNLTPEDIAKRDKKLISDPEAAQYLDSAQLNKLMETLKQTDRDKIRTTLENKINDTVYKAIDTAVKAEMVTMGPGTTMDKAIENIKNTGRGSSLMYNGHEVDGQEIRKLRQIETWFRTPLGKIF